jgi:hypothetical protein
MLKAATAEANRRSGEADALPSSTIGVESKRLFDAVGSL